MSKYTLYKEATGELDGLLAGGVPVPDEIPSGYSYLEGHYDALTEYFSDEAVTPRPTFTLQPDTLSVEVGQVLTISGITVGTTVTHPDGKIVIDDPSDTSIVWSCAEPGDYKFTFENFPYIPETLIATVTA